MEISLQMYIATSKRVIIRHHSYVVVMWAQHTVIWLLFFFLSEWHVALNQYLRSMARGSMLIPALYSMWLQHTVMWGQHTVPSNVRLHETNKRWKVRAALGLEQI